MIYHMDTSEKSSLISEIYYDDVNEILTIVFKESYFISFEEYTGVRKYFFDQFSEVSSIGRYYHYIIKNKFKTKKMAEKKDFGSNKASDKKRFIKMRIKLNEIKKEWLYLGENNTVYADITLHLLPDGTVDRYGNLGMITQDVPKEVYEKEKNLSASQKSSGTILGNGFEFKKKDSFEGSPGSGSGTLAMSSEATKEAIDDLPF